jgi:ATP-dependent Zn protease
MSTITAREFIQSEPEMFCVPVHEAGHALAAFLLGLDFGRVSVVPKKGSAGRVSMGSTNYLDIFHSAKRSKSWAVMSLAGEQAERLILRVRTPDYEQSLDSECADHREFGLVARADNLPRLRKLTYRLLRKHRPLLEELAEHLFFREFMEGRQVRSFLRKRLGSLQRGAQ